jgi:hypothetical protein
LVAYLKFYQNRLPVRALCMTTSSLPENERISRGRKEYRHPRTVRPAMRKDLHFNCTGLNWRLYLCEYIQHFQGRRRLTTLGRMAGRDFGVSTARNMLDGNRYDIRCIGKDEFGRIRTFPYIYCTLHSAKVHWLRLELRRPKDERHPG